MPSQCACVKKHSPRPFAYQVHHVLPRGWGGPDIVANKAIVCGTLHDAIHHALDETVRIAYRPGGDGSLTTKELAALIRPYNAYAASLILRAVEAVGFRIPRVFTLSSGGTHDEPHCSE